MAQTLIASQSFEISVTGCVQTLSSLSILSLQDFPECVLTSDAVNCFQSNVTAVFSEIAVLISYWATFIGHLCQC